jgi:predicted dinucleotide-binding enzyme
MDRKSIMSYAIVGFGKIGQALAHAFARKDIDVTVASRRRANFFEQRATEYLKATKSRRLGWA